MNVVAIAEPTSIVFGEPNSSQRDGPDYPIIDEKKTVVVDNPIMTQGADVKIRVGSFLARAADSYYSPRNLK